MQLKKFTTQKDGKFCFYHSKTRVHSLQNDGGMQNPNRLSPYTVTGGWQRC